MTTPLCFLRVYVSWLLDGKLKCQIPVSTISSLVNMKKTRIKSFFRWEQKILQNVEKSNLYRPACLKTATIRDIKWFTEELLAFALMAACQTLHSFHVNTYENRHKHTFQWCLGRWTGHHALLHYRKQKLESILHKLVLLRSEIPGSSAGCMKSFITVFQSTGRFFSEVRWGCFGHST